MAETKKRARMGRDVPAKIIKLLAEKEKTPKWLSDKTGIDHDKIRAVLFDRKGSFSEKQIQDINEALGSEFKLIRPQEEPLVRDARDDIYDYLKGQKRTVSWLSEETGIKYSGLYAAISEKRIELKPERLEIINRVLGQNFK